MSNTHTNIWAHSLRPIQNILKPINPTCGHCTSPRYLTISGAPQSLVPALHQNQPALWAAPTCTVAQCCAVSGQWRGSTVSAQGLEEGHNGFNGITWAMRSDDTAWPIDQENDVLAGGPAKRWPKLFFKSPVAGVNLAVDVGNDMGIQLLTMG